jgi:hypothetical protein
MPKKRSRMHQYADKYDELTSTLLESIGVAGTPEEAMEAVQDAVDAMLQVAAVWMNIRICNGDLPDEMLIEMQSVMAGEGKRAMLVNAGQRGKEILAEMQKLGTAKPPRHEMN